MNDDQFSNTGVKLRKLRCLHDLEQKHLASLLQISQSYYSKIEAFDYSKHLSFIPLLAAAYKLNARYLLEACSLDYCIDDAVEFSRQYHLLVETSNNQR